MLMMKSGVFRPTRLVSLRKLGEQHAQHGLDAFALAHAVPAMGTHVREAMQVILAVAREQQRIVEHAFQQRERVHLARDPHPAGVGDELPARCEDALTLKLEDLGFGVGPAGQGLGFSDVLVDGNGASGHEIGHYARRLAVGCGLR